MVFLPGGHAAVGILQGESSLGHVSCGWVLSRFFPGCRCLRSLVLVWWAFSNTWCNARRKWIHILPALSCIFSQYSPGIPTQIQPWNTPHPKTVFPWSIKCLINPHRFASSAHKFVGWTHRACTPLKWSSVDAPMSELDVVFGCLFTRGPLSVFSCQNKALSWWFIRSIWPISDHVGDTTARFGDRNMQFSFPVCDPRVCIPRKLS